MVKNSSGLDWTCIRSRNLPKWTLLCWTDLISVSFMWSLLIYILNTINELIFYHFFVLFCCFITNKIVDMMPIIIIWREKSAKLWCRLVDYLLIQSKINFYVRRSLT